MVAVEVGAEAGKVVLEEEDAEELRGAELDEHVPGGGDGEKDGEAERVEGADEGARVSLGRQKAMRTKAARAGATGPLASVARALRA